MTTASPTVDGLCGEKEEVFQTNAITEKSPISLIAHCACDHLISLVLMGAFTALSKIKTASMFLTILNGMSPFSKCIFNYVGE